MLTDYQMLLIFFSIATTICFFIIPIVWEYTNRSKLYTSLSVIIIFFLIFSSIHYHDCRKESIKNCVNAHTEGISYNYCGDNYFSKNSKISLAIYCVYNLEDNCNLIPKGCLDKGQENIDGFCISIIPLCFSPNSD